MAKMKQVGGHVVHTPLNMVFQMLELGGSGIQKYDAGMRSFEPNRLVTPFVMRPSALVEDPDSKSLADVSAKLVNVAWDLTLRNTEDAGKVTLLKEGRDFAIESGSKGLVLLYNVMPDNVLHVEFSADYVDERRGEVLPLSWSRDIITMVQTARNVSLDHGLWPSKRRLSPFKSFGVFNIPVQLKYGDKEVPDDKASYLWEVFDRAEGAWTRNIEDCLWYVAGQNTKVIRIDQEYVQDVLLRVTAVAFGDNTTTQYFTTRLKRWYGQYEEDVDFITGKYIFKDTDTVVIEGKVTNRQGNISNITRYFDAELFFAVGDREMESVGYGSEVTVKRKDLQEGAPRAGYLVRELTAFLPIVTDDGKILTDDDDRPLVAQFPSTDKDM